MGGAGCGRHRQKGHWGMLTKSLAPGSAKDPVSKECSGEGESEIPTVLFWPLQTLAFTFTHTPHTPYTWLKIK